MNPEGIVTRSLRLSAHCFVWGFSAAYNFYIFRLTPVVLITVFFFPVADSICFPVHSAKQHNKKTTASPSKKWQLTAEHLATWEPHSFLWWWRPNTDLTERGEKVGADIPHMPQNHVVVFIWSFNRETGRKELLRYLQRNLAKFFEGFIWGQ